MFELSKIRKKINGLNATSLLLLHNDSRKGLTLYFTAKSIVFSFFPSYVNQNLQKQQLK